MRETTRVLGTRIDRGEAALVEAAAALSGLTVSAFLRRAALEEASELAAVTADRGRLVKNEQPGT